MAKYRKKPVEIEAFRWTGGPDQAEDPEWIIEKIKSGDVWFYAEERGTFMQIQTLEGVMQATPGDWIIQGVKGEIYPCKPDIFEATYEPVPEDIPQMRWDIAVENAKFMLEEYKKIPTGVFGAVWIAQAIARYEKGERTVELLEELEQIK